jgi:DNA-binding GntR family transcriptional regulator
MATNLKDLAYRSILEQIEKGKYPPGTFLSEVALARDLGMSRGPIREAISHLQSEGCIEQVQGRGSYVRLPDRKELEDIYQLREWLECAAVAEVAADSGHAPLPELRACYDKMAVLAQTIRATEAIPEQERIYQQFRALDADMHGVLLRAVGNEEVTKVLTKLRLLTRVFGSRKEDPAETAAARVERTLAEHGVIIDELARRNVTAAVEAMRKHIRNGKRQALASLTAPRQSDAASATLDRTTEIGRQITALRKYRRP